MRLASEWCQLEECQSEVACGGDPWSPVVGSVQMVATWRFKTFTIFGGEVLFDHGVFGSAARS